MCARAGTRDVDVTAHCVGGCSQAWFGIHATPPPTTPHGQNTSNRSHQSLDPAIVPPQTVLRSVVGSLLARRAHGCTGKAM